MKIFSKFTSVNISKLHFWLVICIAKNFIWTSLKAIFSIFRFFYIFQIGQILSYPNKLYIDGKLIYSAFRWCINLNWKNWPLWLVLWSRVKYIKWFNKKNEQIIWQNCEIVSSLYFTFAGYVFVFMPCKWNSKNWINSCIHSNKLINK